MHSPEKAKTEMISWMVTQLNKIHRWTPEKEGGRVYGGWGKGVGEGEQREGKGMEERRESYTTCDYSTQNYEGKTHLHKSCCSSFVFKRTTLRLLLQTLPRGSTRHSP